MVDGTLHLALKILITSYFGFTEKPKDFRRMKASEVTVINNNGGTNPAGGNSGFWERQFLGWNFVLLER